MKKFWFDGVSSASMGLHITGSATFGAPERDVEMISIPGRNGDLIIDHGRFKNIQVSYPVSIPRDFPERAAEVRAWLLSRQGYKRLEDDYDPDLFRLAAYKGPLGLEGGDLNRTGEGTIHFDCKPQRFLKAGERPVTFYAAGTLRNPTPFPAAPVISVTGNGAGTWSRLTVGQYLITIMKMGTNLTIDCDTMEIYTTAEDGTVTAEGNLLIGLTGGGLNAYDHQDAVALAPGDNAISFDGGITAVTVKPRWWTL